MLGMKTFKYTLSSTWILWIMYCRYVLRQKLSAIWNTPLNNHSISPNQITRATHLTNNMNHSSQQPQHLTKHNNMNSPLNNHNISPSTTTWILLSTTITSHQAQQHEPLLSTTTTFHQAQQHAPLLSTTTTSHQAQQHEFSSQQP